MVMEYRELTLSSLIRDHGPMPDTALPTYLNQMTSVSKYLLEKAIIHRDIKPSNILLRHSSWDEGKLHLQICDFGLVN